MIRHPAREQLHRLTVKTLDQVFIMRVKEGLVCSLFEADAEENPTAGTSTVLLLSRSANCPPPSSKVSVELPCRPAI